MAARLARLLTGILSHPPLPRQRRVSGVAGAPRRGDAAVPAIRQEPRAAREACAQCGDTA